MALSPKPTKIILLVFITTWLVVTLKFGFIPQNVSVYAVEQQLELFNDPAFYNGVAVGYGNTFDYNGNVACKDRWLGILPNYSAIKWMFWEGTERFHFCDNPTNNPTVTTNQIQYISPNSGIKKFTTNRTGTIHLEHDTGWEWRGGCNLCKPWDINPPNPPILPVHGNPFFNWNHYLVGQLFSPNYIPTFTAPTLNDFPDNQRINLTKYNSLMFHGQLRLNDMAKTGGGNCPPGDWKPDTCSDLTCTGSDCPVIPNHALFYLAFVLWRTTPAPSGSGEPNIIYPILPMMYTEDGIGYFSGQLPVVMFDPLGDAVYFANHGPGSDPYVPHLVEGQWVNFDLDLYALSNKVLQDVAVAQEIPPLDPANYFVSIFLAGWEIWGGYKTDVEIKELRLTATYTPGDTNGDHLVNLTDFNTVKNNHDTTNANADVNDDGIVNIHDLGIVATNYNQ